MNESRKKFNHSVIGKLRFVLPILLVVLSAIWIIGLFTMTAILEPKLLKSMPAITSMENLIARSIWTLIFGSLQSILFMLCFFVSFLDHIRFFNKANQPFSKGCLAAYFLIFIQFFLLITEVIGLIGQAINGPQVSHIVFATMSLASCCLFMFVWNLEDLIRLTQVPRVERCFHFVWWVFRFCFTIPYYKLFILMLFPQTRKFAEIGFVVLQGLFFMSVGVQWFLYDFVVAGMMKRKMEREYATRMSTEETELDVDAKEWLLTKEEELL